jgi:branched-chain amino acid transport system ATP-binding protein
VTSGTIALNGRSIAGLAPHEINRLGLSRSFQITSIFPRMTVFENIRCGLLWARGYRYSFWHLLGGERALNEEADRMLDADSAWQDRRPPAGRACCPTAEQRRARDRHHRWRRRPTSFLLDEPTSGMSHSENEQAGAADPRRSLEGKTLLMVEHDMSVVFRLADVFTVLVYGEIIASGPAGRRFRANRRGPGSLSRQPRHA